MSAISLKCALRNKCLLSLGEAVENLRDGQERGRGDRKKTKLASGCPFYHSGCWWPISADTTQ